MKKDRGAKQEGSALEELIAEILLPMSDVIVMKDKAGRISIFKEGIKFGMIQDEAFHLFDKDGEYQKVKRELILDADKLLQEATKSFWYACGKMDFSKHN